MTMQANAYKTKKEFKAAVEADPCSVMIDDPALVPAWRRFPEWPRFSLDHLEAGDVIVVTAHPARKWFAEVKCLGGGKFKVY